jgi:spore photoproduct lyase
MYIREAENKGRFIKPCPGTPRYLCCGYKIIDFAHGCNLGCSYCILDNYLGNEPPTIYKNTDKLFSELEPYLDKQGGITRFGTGEFTDSLLSEQALPFYSALIPMFSYSNNAVLELKTKTTNIKGLIKIRDHDNTIVSWSLNSHYTARRDEKKAPCIEDRIKAAYMAQEAGFKLAFHFDPIIIHNSWEDEYKKTIDLIFENIHTENIVYISMGTLRFLPEMKNVMRKISIGNKEWEFIKGLDNKLRYFRPIRTAVYQKIKSYLQHFVKEDIIYMCMENPTVWEDVFEINQMTTEKLTYRLDKACFNKFDLIQ